MELETANLARPAAVDTGAVKMQLQGLWRGSEQRGVELLQQGDRVGAAACFRRCLVIDPEQHWASWLLATALFAQPDADLAELDRLTEQAVQWQLQHKLDRSRQVYLRMLVLQRLRRDADAAQLRTDYLARPDADADPDVLKLLQQSGG